ncbi:autophagy-related protein 22-like protein [Chlamydoabsidia padenii]|nr:autophagy-related protein 22-like protein [Chlamydoabsidia padenii]
MSGEKLLKDPFQGNDDIDPTTDKGREVLSQPPATRWELWSYYLYYNGNNGYNMYAFLPSLLQMMGQKGGFDPTVEGHPPCSLALSSESPCNVAWPGTANGIPVVSMIMYVTAISFGIQFLLFTTFGSLADYGRFNHYILISATLISCAAQILPVIFINDDGHGWPGMMALNIVAMVSYGVTLVCYSAAFPVLSDNLPIVRKTRADPTVSVEETQNVVEKWRNHVSAISTGWSNVGFLILSAVFSSLSFLPWSQGPFLNDDHQFGNTPLYYHIASISCGCFWLINAIPYFIFRPVGRRGPPLPANESHFTIGWKSTFKALREARKNRYLFLYFFSYFLFSDGVNAISSMQTYIQNDITSFSATQTVVQGFITAITSIIGCFFFLFLSKRFNVSTKANLMTILITTAVVPIWGSFGIGFSNFGMKTQWELWVLSAWSGFFTAPVWAWQQTLLSELIPRGKENLYFGLCGVFNKSSAIIGATAIGAVTQQTSNAYYGWLIIAGLFIVAIFILYFVDMEAAKLEMLHMEIQEELAQNATAIHSISTLQDGESYAKVELIEDQTASHPSHHT